MMDVREKLIELLNEAFFDYNHGKGDSYIPRNFADHLVANGVTVQECGHWISYQSDESYGCMDDTEWYKCSKCGKDANGRVDEDKWYSAPILSAYCPHCGAKMAPQPPKGE